MKKIFVLVLSLALVLVLQACTLPGFEFSGEVNPIDDTTGNGEQNGGDVPPDVTESPPPATELPPAPPPEDTATPTNTPENTQSPTATEICDLVEFVTDVTVPDGSKADPDQAFTKVWRLKNAGACTWTSSYDLVFSSGDQMGAPADVQLTAGTVGPGETVDVSVELTAPSDPGTYQGFFKLRNGSGVVFGLAGDNPFWVEIEVKEPDDESPPLVFIPVFYVNYTAGYAGGWVCDDQARRSLKINNTGLLDIESMKIRLEGPIGTYLNGFGNNAPFRPVPPEPMPQCKQAGASKLAIGDSAWVSVHTTNPPPNGTPGRIIVELCSEDGYTGSCKEVTVDFTW